MVVLFLDEIERLSLAFVRSNHQEFLLWFAFFYRTFVITQVIFSHVVIGKSPQIVCELRIDLITILDTFNLLKIPLNPLGSRNCMLIIVIFLSTIHIQINGLLRFIIRIRKIDVLILIHERLDTKIVAKSGFVRSCRIMHP